MLLIRICLATVLTYLFGEVALFPPKYNLNIASLKAIPFGNWI